MLDDWWKERRAALRSDRLAREQGDPGLPAYPWDVHGVVGDPPIPVSYVASARERQQKVIDLHRLHDQFLKLLGRKP